MAKAPAANSPLSGEVLFYQKPEPVNLEQHKKLGLNPTATPFAFAKTAHALPLIVGEFGPASLTYPIIFAGADYQPLAVMSIRMNENLFIDDKGVFSDNAYIPAFLRRYPFVFAQDSSQDQMILCIDRAAAVVAENGEVPLFNDNELSDFTKQCMEFCTNFEQERRRTEEFVKMLRALDVFELREVNFTPRNADGTNGEPVKVSEHFSPSEEKMKALPEATQLDLLKSGALQQIHLHWNSLLNWERLISETMRRFPQPVGNA